MPKAGKYEYPFFDLDSCVEKLRAYHKVVQTEETTRILMAETLEMSMTGGGFVNLVSSMRIYGLIETGGKNVKITDLGKKILYGEATEKEQAGKKAVSSIDLFRELYEQFGKDIQQEQIRSFLRQKANVDISKAEKMAKSIDTIYKKVSNYIIPAQKLAPKSHIKTFGLKQGRGEMPTETEPLKVQKSGLYIEISSDAKMLENIEDAKEFLAFWEQRLRAKMKQEKEE